MAKESSSKNVYSCELLLTHKLLGKLTFYQNRMPLVYESLNTFVGTSHMSDNRLMSVAM
jgi:hypothetical protein